MLVYIMFDDRSQIRPTATELKSPPNVLHVYIYIYIWYALILLKNVSHHNILCRYLFTVSILYKMESVWYVYICNFCQTCTFFLYWWSYDHKPYQSIPEFRTPVILITASLATKHALTKVMLYNQTILQKLQYCTSGSLLRV